MPIKLTTGQLHILNLVKRDADAHGWTPASAPIFAMLKSFPKELIALESVGNEGRGRVQLTDTATNILTAKNWL